MQKYLWKVQVITAQVRGGTLPLALHVTCKCAGAVPASEVKSVLRELCAGVVQSEGLSSFLRAHNWCSTLSVGKIICACWSYRYIKFDLIWGQEENSICNSKQLFTHIQFWHIASYPKFLRSTATCRTPPRHPSPQSEAPPPPETATSSVPVDGKCAQRFCGSALRYALEQGIRDAREERLSAGWFRKPWCFEDHSFSV